MELALLKRNVLTVLVVDDEPDILEILVEEFIHLGYRTLSAATGYKAILIMKSENVDVVVSDYIMPDGRNFFELLTSGPDLLRH